MLLQIRPVRFLNSIEMLSDHPKLCNAFGCFKKTVHVLHCAMGDYYPYIFLCHEHANDLRMEMNEKDWSEISSIGEEGGQYADR